VLVPQHNYTNLSSAVGLGLIGIEDKDIAIDYECICFDSFVYTSRSCKKVVGIISAFIAPIHHLFFVRYSTFVRWICDSTGQVIQCGTRPQLALKQMNLLWDLQYLLLIGSCLLLKPCVWGYFGIHIFLGFFYVICHIKAASQNMRITEDAGVKGRSGN